jgi:MFS family permease
MTTAGLLLAAATLVLRDAASYPALATGYLLLGAGFGLINPPITNAAVSAMPRAQAGVASAVATSSRQLGNVLGIAVLGSVIASGTRGSAGRGGTAFRAAFTTASHSGWDIAIGCGLAIAILGYLTSPGARPARPQPQSSAAPPDSRASAGAPARTADDPGP